MSEASAGLERLREAVDRGVAQSSLRATAREVGMSPTGLRKFLEGAEPYSATRRKLERWYVREMAQGYVGSLTPSAAESAVEILLHDVTPGHRSEGRRRLIDALREVYGANEPSWLAALDRSRP